MSSIAIGARQLKIHAPQGRWVPGVFVVVAAAVVEAVTVVVASTGEVVAVVVVLAAVVVFATDVVVAATVVATAVVFIVVVVVAVVVAAAVVAVEVFSWSLMPKQLWQSGLLTRRWSELWWQRCEVTIFATWSGHFVCHLDAWDCFCVMDLQGPMKKFGPDLLFSRHTSASAWSFADFSLHLYVFPHLSHVQGTVVGTVSGIILSFAFLTALPAASLNR